MKLVCLRYPKQHLLVPLFPIGTIVPFGGVTISTVGCYVMEENFLIADYNPLYSVIGFQFKDPGQVTSSVTLDYPTLEVGSSGADNMGGTSANRVTDVNADTVGLVLVLRQEQLT